MRYPPQRGSKYPEPAGDRGCCPAAPGDAPRYWGLSLHEYFLRSDVSPVNPDGELLALVMVESHEAIKNIDGILSVPGLGGLLIGPHDLSLSLGVGLPESNPGGARSRGGDRNGGEGMRGAQGALWHVLDDEGRQRSRRAGVQAVPAPADRVWDDTLTGARVNKEAG
jgi:HpcH/HpaI aldolase/citrate lyase family